MRRTGYMKMPAGKDKGLAEQEFELQKEKFQQNDISDEYLEVAYNYLDKFAGMLRATHNPLLTVEREAALNELLDAIYREIRGNAGLFRVYGFRVFIKHPQKDYILAHMELDWDGEGPQTTKLYLGLNVLSRIGVERTEKGKEHADELLRNWLLHELICPIFGYTDAARVIEQFYPADNLHGLLSAVLNGRRSRTETMVAVQRSFSFNVFDLVLEKQGDVCTTALDIIDIRQRLETNWFFMAPASVRQEENIHFSPEKEIVSRIRTVCDRLGDLLTELGILDEKGSTGYPFRLFISGSYFWCGEFIDDMNAEVEVDIVVDGDHDYKRCQLDMKFARHFLGLGQISGRSANVMVNRFGTEQLELAAVGSVKKRDALRRKLILLSHETIQLLGKPLECRPRNSRGVRAVHFENVAEMSNCWRKELTIGRLPAKELDWLALRVKAVEAYCSGPALAENARYAKAAEEEKKRLQGKLVGVVSKLFRKMSQKVLKRWSPSDSDEDGESDEEIQGAFARRIMCDADRATIMSLGEPSGDSSGKVRVEVQQSMSSFYGLPVGKGDVLTGYQGRYRLGEKIGQGAQGGVWTAKVLDEQGEEIREVAVKVPSRHPEWNWNKEAEWMASVAFYKEIDALNRLIWHPNVIRLEDWYLEGGDVPFYVMEAVSGTNLFDYFDNRGFSERDIFRMSSRLAEGLKALHSEGLAHRDLKPQNIMIRDSDGQPVILDFGTASDMESVSGSFEFFDNGDVQGTPVFMAPEMAARLDEAKYPHLMICKDSAFHGNGCTRQCSADAIVHRIECAAEGGDDDGARLSITEPGFFTRVRMRIAMHRVMPVLRRLHESGAILELPSFRTCRIIECGETTFGAYCHGDVLYIERPLISNKPFESILMGEPELVFRQDIFSLGIMMYIRLTWPKRPTAGGFTSGELPFVLPDDEVDVYGAVLSRVAQKYRPLSYWFRKRPEQYHSLSPATEAVVMRTLCKDPFDRYSSEELCDELKELAEVPASKFENHSKEYRRKKRNALMIRAFFLLATAAALAGVGFRTVTRLSPDVPSYLLPTSGNAGILEWALHISVITLWGGLAMVAAIPVLLGVVLLLRRRILRFIKLKQEIARRKV